MADTNKGRALGWDDNIEQESDYVLLKKGDYDFMIVNFERGEYNGSEKMSACKKATVHVKIVDPASGQDVIIFHNLFLLDTMEWKLSEFFLALGLKERKKPLRMCWDRVVGCRGRCKIEPQEYKGKTYNNITKFYDPAEQPTQSKGYTAGSF